MPAGLSAARDTQVSVPQCRSCGGQSVRYLRLHAGWAARANGRSAYTRTHDDDDNDDDHDDNYEDDGDDDADDDDNNGRNRGRRRRRTEAHGLIDCTLVYERMQNKFR